jgi:tellurite resistance protein TerC
MMLIDLYKIPITWSLGFTVLTLAITMVLSLKIPARKGASSTSFPFSAKEKGSSKDGN